MWWFEPRCRRQATTKVLINLARTSLVMSARSYAQIDYRLYYRKKGFPMYLFVFFAAVFRDNHLRKWILWPMSSYMRLALSMWNNVEEIEFTLFIAKYPWRCIITFVYLYIAKKKLHADERAHILRQLNRGRAVCCECAVIYIIQHWKCYDVWAVNVLIRAHVARRKKPHTHL